MGRRRLNKVPLFRRVPRETLESVARLEAEMPLECWIAGLVRVLDEDRVLMERLRKWGVSSDGAFAE